MENFGDHPWTLTRRHVFAAGEAPATSLTIVSGTHGWGKTAWMQQYDHYLREHGLLCPVWVRSRGQLETVLTEPGRVDGQAVFADLLLPTAGDTLWDEVRHFAEGNQDSMLVVSSVDRASPEIVSRCKAWEVWERGLAFTRSELEEVVAANLPGLAPQETALLRDRLRGQPYLVRRHLERVRSSHGVEFWSNPDCPTERLLIRQFQAYGPLLQEESHYLRLLMTAATFRRFDRSMLPGTEGEDGVSAEQFERLQMSPVGRFEVDQLTGRDTFEWSPPAWQSIRSDFPHRATVEARREAFQRTLDSGAVTLALFYLLDLGLHTEADDFVDRNLRLFLLHTPAVVESQIMGLPQWVLDECPNLAIVRGELLTRTGNRSVSARRAFHAALAKLKQRADRDVRERYRTLVRKAFCRVSLGDREGANRRLNSVMELLGTEDEPGPVLVTAASEPAIGSVLSDELYLPFWTATQLDRHRDALRLAQLMRVWARWETPTAIATALTVISEEVFAGVLSSSTDMLPPGVGHSDGMQLLGEGRGREALELVRGIDSHRRSSPTRSAAEGLVLTVRALEEPETLTVSQVRETVERSRRFWGDGRPSTFVAQAASLAYLAMQRPDLSREVLGAYEEQEEDWFVTAAIAIERLVSGEPGEAMAALAGLREAPEVPRADAVAGVLAAAACAGLGQEEAARLRLGSLWMRSEASLIRYALRLIPKDLFMMLYGYKDRFHEGLAEVLQDSLGDPHVLANTRVPSLSRSEMETLELLRSGKTYGDVAKARFVSLNTVRTQVKALYRKLGAKGRDEAVTRAETIGLL